jgi:hypothetical protein
MSLGWKDENAFAGKASVCVTSSEEVEIVQIQKKGKCKDFAWHGV